MKKLVKQIFCLTLSGFVLFFASCKPKENESVNNSEKFTDIILAENQNTAYNIVIPQQASEPEIYAAELLAENFTNATGATISIVEDNAQKLDESKKILSVGRTSICADSKLSLSVSELTYGGYKIKRYGNTVVLCGAQEEGTIYAAQEFLKKEFNYEVYATDEVYIEKKNKVNLMDFDIVDIPDFWGRGTDGLLGYSESLAVSLRVRNKFSSSLGYGSTYDFIPGTSHTFKMIIDPEIYNNPTLYPDSYHSEWFSGNQICLTNKELIQEATKNVKQMILDNPQAKIVNISEEDFGKFCTCDECVAERSAYTTSGYIIRFCNKIIEQLEQWKKDSGIKREWVYCTFAYTCAGSIIPPVDEKINEDGLSTYTVKDASCTPHEKLYIRLAPLSPVCWYHTLDDENCSMNGAGMAKYLKGWSAISDRFMVWDYDANFGAYFAFLDNFTALQKNLQLYEEMGIEHIYRQNTKGSQIRSMSALNAYLTGKLMWNVDEDLTQLIDGFCNNYYKSGATYMKQYLTMMRLHWRMMDETSEKGFHSHTNEKVDPAKWPIRILEQALELIEKADATYESLKKTDPDAYEKMHLRVLQEHFCIRWMILENYSAYYNINSTAYTEMLNQFEKDAQILGAVSHAENKSLIDWIESKRI